MVKRQSNVPLKELHASFPMGGVIFCAADM